MKTPPIARTYTTLGESVGCTIEAVGETGSCLAIALSGEQFAFIEARNGWGDDGAGEIEEHEPQLRPCVYPHGDDTHRAMVAAGIWTWEEIGEVTRRARQSRIASAQAAERAEYERLKAKFDPPPGIDQTIPATSEGWILDNSPNAGESLTNAPPVQL